MPAREVRAEIERLAARQQHSVNLRVKRWRLGGDSRKRGDRLRGDIGLLRGDTAMLDRKGGRVPGGKHAIKSADLAMDVHRDEAAGTVGRYTRHRRPDQLWQRDDLVDMQVARAGVDGNPAALVDLAMSRGERQDPALLEQAPHAVADVRTEDRQRRVLRSRDRDRQLDVHVVRPRGRHQRQLVDRHVTSDATPVLLLNEFIKPF